MKKQQPIIGLKRNTVKIIPYQEEWNEIFKKTKAVLHELLKEEIQQIEHIGSTAIKDMPSKPIIDIAVGIESYDKLDKIEQVLVQNSYEYRGERTGGYLFVKREKGLTTHHIHFVLSTEQRWKNYIYFRNKLNTDSRLRKQYLALKQKLVNKFADNRGKYTKSKNEFITTILTTTEK